MKLFKKLAAAALAAVLALSMVGCGNASGVNSTKQFILNMMNDMADLTGTEYNNTPDMDGIAQKLLTEANAAYQEETQKDKDVKTLLNVAVEKMKKDGVLNKDTGYTIDFVEDYQFKYSLTPDAEKQAALMRRMEHISENGGLGNATKADVGVVVGKIGNKTYVVMVMMPTETAAAPGTPDKY
mgnify:FL=1